jgi:hypothetical protein
MPIPPADSARFAALISLWRLYGAPLTDPQLSCKLKNDLYQVRNAGWNGNPAITVWPAHLIDPDDGMMAAVEHYFLCRCWVGTGVQPAWQLKAMNGIYDTGKKLGVTPRHNPNKPPSPPTELQVFAKAAGVRDGEADLKASGASAPWISKPPTY